MVTQSSGLDSRTIRYSNNREIEKGYTFRENYILRTLWKATRAGPIFSRVSENADIRSISYTLQSQNWEGVPSSCVRRSALIFFVPRERMRLRICLICGLDFWPDSWSPRLEIPSDPSPRSG
jgi:hypothetical protein